MQWQWQKEQGCNSLHGNRQVGAALGGKTGEISVFKQTITTFFYIFFQAYYVLFVLFSLSIILILLFHHLASVFPLVGEGHQANSQFPKPGPTVMVHLDS